MINYKILSEYKWRIRFGEYQVTHPFSFGLVFFGGGGVEGDGGLCVVFFSFFFFSFFLVSLSLLCPLSQTLLVSLDCPFSNVYLHVYENLQKLLVGSVCRSEYSAIVY